MLEECFWIQKFCVCRFWLWGCNPYCILYLADGFLFHFHACAGFVRAFMWVFRLVHVCARIQTHILMCTCVQRWMCNLSQRGSKGPHLQEICREHHCHLERREQREREEMKQRTEGSHSAPRHCYFKLFSSYWGTIHCTHAHLEHSLRAAQSALSANRRKRKIKEQRDKKKEGQGERYRQQGRLYGKYLIHRGFTLHSSSTTFTLVWCKTCINTIWARGSFLRSLTFQQFFPLLQLPAMLHRVWEKGMRELETYRQVMIKHKFLFTVLEIHSFCWLILTY